MRAAIEALRSLPVTGRRIAVLGVMAELADPVAEHGEIATILRDYGIDLIAVGTEMYGVAPTANPLDDLKSLTSDDAVLVKGSRVAGLERLAGLVVEQ